MPRLKHRKKSKRNVILFSTLGTVLLALLLLPKDALLIGNKEEQKAEPKKKEPMHKVVKLQPDNLDAYKDEDQDKTKKEKKQSKDEKEIGIDPEKEKEKKQKAEAEAKKQKAAEQKKAAEQQQQPNLEGPWEPIGTSQKGEHTSSYDEGSVDWNEKLKAVKLATGLDDTMTVWKIGNDGGPQNSVATVSPNKEPNNKYVVHLEWVDQQGWKVTSIEH